MNEDAAAKSLCATLWADEDDCGKQDHADLFRQVTCRPCAPGIPHLNTIMKPAMNAKAWNGYGCRKNFFGLAGSIFLPIKVNSSRQAAIIPAASENGRARGIADPYQYLKVQRPQYTFGYLIMVPSAAAYSKRKTWPQSAAL